MQGGENNSKAAMKNPLDSRDAELLALIAPGEVDPGRVLRDKTLFRSAQETALPLKRKFMGDDMGVDLGAFDMPVGAMPLEGGAAPVGKVALGALTSVGGLGSLSSIKGNESLASLPRVESGGRKRPGGSKKNEGDMAVDSPKRQRMAVDGISREASRMSVNSA